MPGIKIGYRNNNFAKTTTRVCWDFLSNLWVSKIRAKQDYFANILELQDVFFWHRAAGSAISHFLGKGWSRAGVVGLGSRVGFGQDSSLSAKKPNKQEVPKIALFCPLSV